MRRLRESAPRAAAFHLEAAERKRLTRYAIFNHFNDAGSLLVYGQTDNFFIGAMLSPVAVAAYAFYGKLTEMINNLMPQKLFDNVIQPMFFAVPAAESDARLSRYFTLLIDLNLALQLPAIAFTIVYHREIVQVFFAGKYLPVLGPLPPGAGLVDRAEQHVGADLSGRPIPRARRLDVGERAIRSVSSRSNARSGALPLDCMERRFPLGASMRCGTSGFGGSCDARCSGVTSKACWRWALLVWGSVVSSAVSCACYAAVAGDRADG